MTTRTTLNYFVVTGSKPVENQAYWKTFCVRIIALDVKDAYEAVYDLNPNAIVWTVSHQGGIDVVTNAAGREIPQR